MKEIQVVLLVLHVITLEERQVIGPRYFIRNSDVVNVNVKAEPKLSGLNQFLLRYLRQPRKEKLVAVVELCLISLLEDVKHAVNADVIV